VTDCQRFVPANFSWLEIVIENHILTQPEKYRVLDVFFSQ